MATTFQVLRQENTKNREGQDEVFVDVQIFDDTVGVINYPRWYTGAQAATLIADPSAIDGIITPIMSALVAQRQYEINNPLPQPNLPVTP